MTLEQKLKECRFRIDKYEDLIKKAKHEDVLPEKFYIDLLKIEEDVERILIEKIKDKIQNMKKWKEKY
jgi:sulfur transfer protein SufE